jgi:Pyruvate/2-oxoacid:ferredoxin oxidoreductase gamma subunit
MLGAVSCFLEFPAESSRQAISGLVKPQALELNLKAFAAGRELGGCA